MYEGRLSVYGRQSEEMGAPKQDQPEDRTENEKCLKKKKKEEEEEGKRRRARQQKNYWIE